LKVYLVRHGKTEWNRDKKFQGHKNSPLLEEGKEQARLLGERLRDKKIGVLYCSPLLRTRETAELLNLPGEFIPDNAFKEIHLGILEGREFDSLDPDLKPVVESFWNSPHQFDKSLTGGEDFMDIQKRSVQRLKELVESSRDDLLIVSHGALLKSILNYYLEKPLKEFWSPPMLQPASLTVLEFTEGKFTGIEKLGDTSHYSC
jgi:broad specificity phosphatase PhoE